MPPPPPKLRHVLPFPDKIRLILWKHLHRSYPLILRIRHGPRIILRANSPHDAGIAREIFAEKIYALPPSLASVAPSIKTIADVGANIGYSIAFFQSRFPASHIIAFEPHPAHIAAIRQHFDLNATDTTRLTLHPAAAGTAPGNLFLISDGAASNIVSTPAPNSIPVPIVDFFAALGPQRIDLLKMDIEGGEHALLADPRFPTLDIGILVMECHPTPALPNALAHCRNLLAKFGYSLHTPESQNPAGILWASRGVLNSKF